MGECDGLVPNKTHKIVKNDLEHTPYRTFYKYKAEILKTSSNGPTLTTTSGATGNQAETASTPASNSAVVEQHFPDLGSC